jgi:phage terminase large subunit-like protein
VETKDYAAIAQQYARDVVSGKQPACKWIRLQCERFLDELKQQRRKEFPFRFEPRKVARFCAFIECLPHTKGKWARSRETICLEPWQVWIFANAFGWLRKSDGLRRYRVLYVVVPRKNGKSIIAAGAGLYMFCMDGEPGAEVYSGATTEDQAWEVFRPARLMALRSPQLTSALGIEVNAKSLVRHGDQSRFETITGDPGDGQSPSCSIHDEYHEHDDDGQVETMITGMGAREQPMQIIITTAGDNLAGPCYASILEEREKLEGIGCEGGKFPLDHETFFVEYTIDDDDDWKSERALRKANPNMGISVLEDFLFGQQRSAVRTPRKAGVFKTKHLNLWVAARSAYFDIEAWRRCQRDWLPPRADDVLALERLRGRRAIAGLDLASKIDIAALELLILPEGSKATPDDPYIRTGWYFLPEETVSNNPSYTDWHSKELLSANPGNIIDYDEILLKLEEISKILQLEQVPYDPHQANYFVTTALKAGMPMLEYRQIVLNMSEPMKELDAVTRAGTIAHGGCAVMEWQMNNVVATLDAKDNVYPRKPRAEAKIDNPVALIMALGASMVGNESTQSFWEVMNA